MADERWRRLEEIFHEALERQGQARANFVRAACGDDEALRLEIESLIVNDGLTDSRLGIGYSKLATGRVRAELIGRQIGVYQIVSLLGVGGMGEVYRARDTKLNREVALKVLPEEFAFDADRLARFKREAQILASLNHPNIAQIHGLEESDSIKALVMELVEGPTLADRIAQGPIPLDQALPMAKQIAEALEAAHEQGIIHRDLKPANIKITLTDHVKVLDFGLAKLVEVPDSGLQATALSSEGMIVGTAAYMSPEQGRGKSVDKRTDIWAFGCVLYELLTGRTAFAGDTAPDTIAAILEREPEWRALPANTPPAIRALLMRCLQKDSRRRMRDIADARFQIDEAEQAPTASASKRSGYTGWIAASLVVIAGSIATLVFTDRSLTDPPEMRLQFSTPPAQFPSSLAISPDGRTVVFQAGAGARSQLWLRPLQSDTAQPLAGTEEAHYPFWSPDSRSFGFFAAQQLKRIDLAEGLVRTLAEVPSIRGGAWSVRGTILFGSGSGPLYRVPANGGAKVEVTRLTPGQTSHRHPHFLPDGNQFLFFALGAPESRGVYLGSLSSPEIRRLIDADSEAGFVPPDQLLFVRQGALWVQRLSPDSVLPTGEPWLMARQVLTDSEITAEAAFSASAAGPVAYRAEAGERQLIWLDRSGRQIASLGGPDTAQPTAIQLSPDGQTVAFSRTVAGNIDVWLMDVARGAPRRLIAEPTQEVFARFSPDGSRIVFNSNRNGEIDNLYEKRVDGVGSDTLLLASSDHKTPLDWSADGRYILYASQSPKTSLDLWVLPLVGDRKPWAVVETAFDDGSAGHGGRFSPDGRWIAYHSNDSGRDEIYVQPFPGPGGRLPISTSGGSSPQWRKDGRELFYIAPDNSLMAASVRLKGSGGEVGIPVKLFLMPFSLARQGDYAASPDGQRFLINMANAGKESISILLNWKPPRR